MAPGRVRVFWLRSSFFLELLTYVWDLLLSPLCLHSEPSPCCRVLQTFSAGTGSRRAPFPLLHSPPHRGPPPEAWLPVFLADPRPHLFILAWVNLCSPDLSWPVFTGLRSPLGSLETVEIERGLLGQCGGHWGPLFSFPVLMDLQAPAEGGGRRGCGACSCVCANVGRGVWRCCSWSYDVIEYLAAPRSVCPGGLSWIVVTLFVSVFFSVDSRLLIVCVA